METFNKDFSNVLGDKLDFNADMASPPMHIHMCEGVNVKPLNVKPLNVKVARQVPLHLQGMAKNVVSDLVDRKQITRVTVPTIWC